MKYLAFPLTLTLLLACCLMITGCGGNWKDYDYGPGSWLVDQGVIDACTPETTGLCMHSTYHNKGMEERLHIVDMDTMTRLCGYDADGCSILEAGVCHIYLFGPIEERRNRQIYAHEIGDCYSGAGRHPHPI